MAGRGCTITITILPSTVNDDSNIIDQTQEINLPVALHSPLEILRDQIERLTSIIVTDQVLILCDLSDPERNSDILLDGRNHVSLRDCGIRNGSNLTLHALGLSAEKRMKLLKEAIILNNNKTKVDQLPPALLNTKISAADANHSYNGVIFDIQVKGPHEVEINSISIAGMLGPVCIYARDREWAIDNDDEPSPHWWAHRESISQTGWTLVAKVDCLPSWDKPYEIMFNKPFRMLPHSKHGFYCHSSLPDDLGIQYQSYQPGDIIAEDDVLKILPGLGHTGSLPFDNHHGWYRAYRGLAGRVSYSAKIKGWTVDEHDLFPVELKQGVKTMLLAHYHCESHNDSDNNSSNNYQQQQQQSKQRRLDAQANNDNNNNNDVDIDVDKDYDDLPALLDLYTASGKRNQYTVKNSNSSSSNSDNVSDDSKDCSQKMAVVQDSGFNNDNENSNSTYATTVESSSSFSPPPPLSSPLILSPPISPRSTSSVLMGSFKNSVMNRLSPSSSAATTSATSSTAAQTTASIAAATSSATSTEAAATTSAAVSSTTPRNRFYGMKTAVFKPPPVTNRAPIFPSLSPPQYNNTNNNTSSSSKSTSSNSNSNIASSSRSNSDRKNEGSMMMTSSSSKKNGSVSLGGNKNAKNNFNYDLPKFILYNIMEYMHWDWFLDVAVPPSPRPPTVRSKTRAFVDSVTAHATNAVAVINAGTATASTTNGFELMNLIQLLGLQHELTFFHGGTGGQNNNTNNQNDYDEEDDNEEEEEYDDEEVMEDEEEDSDDENNEVDDEAEEEEGGGSEDEEDVMVESHHNYDRDEDQDND